MEHRVIVSKDILIPDYLPVYGNQYWKTPNIDELAEKGTVFNRHYTCAPSTAMAMTGMFTGKFPYELDRKDYSVVEDYDGSTLFDQMYEKGFSCHLIWSHNYIVMAERFSKCFGKHTVHHEDRKLNQSVGVHMPRDDFANEIKPDKKLEREIMGYLKNEIESIDISKPVFLWVHLPHVLLGRTGYGQDIDLFDEFIGYIREKFGDWIIITADHGNMNGAKGKTTYGFDVYEQAAHIPMITPRIQNQKHIEYPTSNVQLSDIVLEEKIPQLEFVLCDSQYYGQPYRKTAIVRGRYKFIYNKLTKAEELYDVLYDPMEQVNLLMNLLCDEDRDRNVNVKQVYFYPYWDEAMENYRIIKDFFCSIWKTAPKVEEKKNYIIRKLKNYKSALKRNLGIK